MIFGTPFVFLPECSERTRFLGPVHRSTRFTSAEIWPKVGFRIKCGELNVLLGGCFWQVASLEPHRKRDLKIRDIQKEDIFHIVQLWQKFGEYHGWLDTPQALARRVQKQGDLFLLAEIEGKIVGSVMGSYDGRFAFAARLVVTPGYRRKGIATKLMQELERRLRDKGASQISLLIEDNNDPAISLYKKMNYTLQEGVSYMRKCPS